MSLPNETSCKIYLSESKKITSNRYILTDIESVLSAVSKESGIQKQWLINTYNYKTRDSEVVEAVAAYSIICQTLWPKSHSRYKNHDVSTTKIGNLVGRDHSTVLHHLKKEWSTTLDLVKKVLDKKI